MDWQAWLTLAVLAAVFVALARELASPDLVLLAGLFTLAALGVLTPAETFHGFANEGLATVAALFVLAAALRDTGALEVALSRVLRPASGEKTGLARMVVPVAGLSAFLNNTPIVAMMTPVVIDWARRTRRSPSRYLIPVDYAAILGGVLTVIGTSTNLVVVGLMQQAGMRPIGLFEIAWVGAPVCAVGLVYLLFVGPRLLPDRKEPAEQVGERRREYTTAMRVEPDGPLPGQTVEQAGLRQLPGLYLIEIDRDGQLLTPVGPDEALLAGDVLVFAGIVASIVDLQRIRGLSAAQGLEEDPAAIRGRRLHEAVVSQSSPLVGSSIRDASFRTVYDAAVVAVHRNGSTVGGKLGEVVLEPGDTLLLQTAPGFLRAHRNSADFYLVSEVPGSEPPRYDRARVAAVVLAAMLALVGLEILPISIAAFLAAGALVLLRCTSLARARQSIDWSVLLVIAAGLGLAAAMDKTGAARSIAGVLMELVPGASPLAAFAVIYLATVILTETLTNNAAAALMFPIAMATAEQLGVDSRGFALGVAVAASCGFASPLGYQTHLIIYGPGGYRFSDFVRIGLPLDILCGVVSMIVIPLVWPF
jgi:di/tricarboxylate transporter